MIVHLAHAVSIVDVLVCIIGLVIVQVLHLSDLHVQLGYKEGAPSTCGKFPVCCLQGIGVLHILIPIVVIDIILLAIGIILFAIVIRIVIAIINQTWNWSKNLHNPIFGERILHNENA